MRSNTFILSLLFTLPAFAQDGAAARVYEFKCDYASIATDGDECRQAYATDGIAEIWADMATSTESEADGKTWQLEGNVRFAWENAELLAERGVFEFDQNNELVRAELAGMPVRLSDYDQAEDTSFSGTADSIVVDNTETTLRLIGRATMLRRTGEREPRGMEGCDLVYNWTEHTLVAGSLVAGNPDCSVRMIWSPSADGAETGPPSDPP